MDHQDWTTVSFSSKPKSQTSTNTPQIKKPSANITALKIENKADNTDERLSIQLIDTKIVREVIKARSALGLSQKDLATKINVQESVIKSLEQNREKHNPTLLNKLQKVLKVKLLGDNIGSAL